MTSPIIRKYPASKNKNLYRETECKDCGKTESRRSDAIKIWQGRCRSCAMTVCANDPLVGKKRRNTYMKTMAGWSAEYKRQRSARIRQQILKQGGVPNAKKFVKEGEEGRRMAGADHHAWKGGTKLQNREGRSSRESVEWRKEILKRDDYTCQICGVRGGKLHADHILPWASYPELRFELSNGRTLCVPCHKTTPTYGWHGKKLTTVVSMNSVVTES